MGIHRISTGWVASLVAGLLVVGIGLVGCSSSDSSANKGTATSSTVPDGLNAVHQGLQDQAAAVQTALVAGDLPGWTPGEVQTNDKSGDAQMARCLGIPNSDTKQTAYTGSREFKRGGVAVYSETTVFTTTAVVQDDVRGLRGPLTTCLAQLATDNGATNVQIKKVALPTTAGALSGFRLTGSFVVPSSSGPQRVAIDEVGLSKGRIELSINMSAGTAAFPPGLMNQLTAKIAQRLRAATT